MSNEVLKPAQQEILQEGYVEELINQSRIPLFLKYKIGISEGEGFSRRAVGFRDEVMIIVPSVEVQPTDRWEHIGAGCFEIFTSEGEQRGKTKYYYVSPAEAEKIKAKIPGLSQGRKENRGIRKKLSAYFSRKK